MFVLKADIERNGSLETAIVALILSRLSSEFRDQGRAWWVWNKCISSAGDFCSNRSVVGIDVIQQLFGNLLTEHRASTQVHFDSKSMQSGLEVLLTEWFPISRDSSDDGNGYIVTDLRRFDEDGSRRLKFQGGCVTIADGVPPVRVINRFATWVGFKDFVIAHPEVLKEKSLAIIESRLNADVNLSAAALEHSEKLERMLKEQFDPTICIHCGRTINVSGANLVEVDEADFPLAIGATHFNCLRSTDRICGRMELQGPSVPSVLRDFDLVAWAKKIIAGQRGITDAVRLAKLNKQIVRMVWTPEKLAATFGSWCVRLKLADGSDRFMKSRSRVDRMGYEEAMKRSSRWNRMIKEAAAIRNPIGCSPRGDFGDRNSILRQFPSSEFVECIDATTSEYSSLFEDTYGDWYAPLCFITERETDQLCVLADEAVPLFSNPLELDQFLQNWSKAGIVVGNVAVHPLLTDAEFDLYCREWFESGLYVTVDPLLNDDGLIVEGVVIVDLNEAVRTIEGEQ